MKSSRLLSPAIFGASDGVTSLVGVLLTLAGHPAQILPAALGLAVAGGVGMAAGSWLSRDSGAGLAASGVIGVATAVGTLLPALPYVLLGGVAAMAASGAVLVALGALITAVRARSESVWRSAAETYGVLAAVCVAVGACALLLPGSSG